jgi:hypothetical protein
MSATELPPTTPQYGPGVGAPQPHAVGLPPQLPGASVHPPLSPVGRLIGAALLDALLSLVTFGIGWMIWACITAAEGRTPAKKLLGMQVVDAATGRPLTWGTYVFMRGLVGGFVAGLAGMMTLGVLHFMPLWDNRNQSIAAKVSNSVVVDRAA